MNKKHLILTAFAVIGVALGASAQMKVGDNPTTINANSVLEMESTNKGMLLPRVALSATNNVAPLTAHVAGMVVYNTATAGDVTPGYYYNDGAQWVRLASGGNGGNVSLPVTNLVSNNSPAGNTPGQLLYNSNPNIGLPVGPVYWDGNNWVPLNPTATEPWYNVATNTGATSNTQDIYQMGNIGIGTASPLARLQIETPGSDAQRTLLLLESNSWATTPNQQASYLIRAGEGAKTVGGLGVFAVRGDGQGFFGGNVGIGTATPATSLDLAGRAGGGRFLISTQGWVDPGPTTGAGIAVDNLIDKTLMIVGGNFGASPTNSGLGNREVSLWDNVTVNGRLRVVGGSPGAGKVLTSDANGLASWTDATSISSSNIYNSDGTLTGARVVNQGGNKLQLNDGPLLKSGTGNINNGIRLQGGDFAAGYGSMWVSGSGGGQQLFISAKQSGGTATEDLTTAGNSNIILNHDGGNVGIGTSGPTARLDVNGTSNLRGIISTSDVIELGSLGSGDRNAFIDFHSQDGQDYNARIIRELGANGLFNIINGSSLVSLNTTGNVGIGTTAPTAKLTVEGTFLVSKGSGAFIGEGFGSTFNITGSSDNLRTFSIHGNSSNPSNIAEFYSSNNGNYILGFLQDNQGRVGIGTTAPAAKLDVAGQVKISGGAPGVGKVLTSDANGLATWETLNASKSSIGLVTTNYTATAADATILCNVPAAGMTLTLPDAAANVGKILVIRKVDNDTDVLTFSPAINYSTTQTVTTLNYLKTLTVQSDGTSWWIINE